MSALQLFNFQNLAPAAPAVIPSKRKKREVTVSLGIPVEYHCGECNRTVTINTNDPIQCPNCSHRVVQKLRSVKPVVYDAV